MLSSIKNNNRLVTTKIVTALTRLSELSELNSSVQQYYNGEVLHIIVKLSTLKIVLVNKELPMARIKLIVYNLKQEDFDFNSNWCSIVEFKDRFGIDITKI